MKLNLGSGRYNLPQSEGWSNVDEDECPFPGVMPDVVVHVPPIDADDNSVDEIFAGHLLEHFAPDEAQAFLAECYRVLCPGGKLGIVVPDTFKVLQAYVSRNPAVVEVPEGYRWELADLDAVCAVFLYSTIQRSPHKWSYDRRTLTHTLTRAGFLVRGAMANDDPRIAVPAWWNCALDAVKPECVG